MINNVGDRPITYIGLHHLADLIHLKNMLVPSSCTYEQYLWAILETEDHNLPGSNREVNLDNQMNTTNFYAAAAEEQNVICSCTSFKDALIFKKNTKFFRYNL